MPSDMFIMNNTNTKLVLDSKMLNFGGKWVIGVFTHEQIQAITRCIYSIIISI